MTGWVGNIIVFSRGGIATKSVFLVTFLLCLLGLFKGDCNCQ